MNAAARIESATKDRQTDIITSDAVVSLLRPEEWTATRFEARGQILLEGKSAPMEVFNVAQLANNMLGHIVYAFYPKHKVAHRERRIDCACRNAGDYPS